MTTEDITIINEENIKETVYEVRGQRVMLDFDLARIYGYETGKLNEQVKNNIGRFPEEFRFRLTREEIDNLPLSKKWISGFKSRFFSQKGGTKYLPHAFNEQGDCMNGRRKK